MVRMVVGLARFLTLSPTKGFCQQLHWRLKQLGKGRRLALEFETAKTTKYNWISLGRAKGFKSSQDDNNWISLG
ncbi:unnamed protein product [Cuscuta campestris]|uniref:Uncharacterized protein n=1 Tax=Cuscuta campestris TaxID=132261 RepID=A0A484LT62_9ASTE|nr:unnamed protein product [Cuscuta campestris]